MEGPDEIRAELLDDSGAICVDVACRRCGYNLRGLQQSSRCPECGTAIGLSCYGDLLRFADPSWVEKLGRGAKFILWGVLVAFLVTVLSVVVDLVFGTQPIIFVITFGASLVGFYGAWLITERDPSGIGEDKYVTDRKIVRLALLVGLAADPLSFFMEWLSLPGALWMGLCGAVLLAGLTEVVGEFAKLTYFRKLALRIPDSKLAKRARSLRWAMAISLGVLVVGGAVGGMFAIVGARAVGPAPGVGPTAVGVGPGAPAGAPASFPVTAPAGPGPGLIAGLAVFGCITVVAGIVYCVVAILILVLVYRLGKAFREQARVARESWWSAAEAGAG